MDILNSMRLNTLTNVVSQASIETNIIDRFMFLNLGSKFKLVKKTDLKQVKHESILKWSEFFFEFDLFIAQEAPKYLLFFTSVGTARSRDYQRCCDCCCDIFADILIIWKIFKVNQAQILTF